MTFCTQCGFDLGKEHVCFMKPKAETRCFTCGAASVAAGGTGCVCASRNAPSSAPTTLSIGTAALTKIPRFELIPKEALISLALRFEKGIERHKEKAWNALSSNYQSALTEEWVLARLGHAIDHAYNALAKLHSGADDGEDDAGALMFAGAVLACYRRRRRDLAEGEKKKQEEKEKAEEPSTILRVYLACERLVLELEEINFSVVDCEPFRREMDRIWHNLTSEERNYLDARSYHQQGKKKE